MMFRDTSKLANSPILYRDERLQAHLDAAEQDIDLLPDLKLVDKVPDTVLIASTKLSPRFVIS